MIDISKGINANSVYGTFCNTIPATKIFKPFIIFGFSGIKDTGILIHILDEDIMG